MLLLNPDFAEHSIRIPIGVGYFNERKALRIHTRNLHVSAKRKASSAKTRRSLKDTGGSVTFLDCVERLLALQSEEMFGHRLESPCYGRQDSSKYPAATGSPALILITDQSPRRGKSR